MVRVRCKPANLHCFDGVLQSFAAEFEDHELSDDIALHAPRWTPIPFSYLMTTLYESIKNNA